MKLTAYVSPSRHGIYYFRWPLPACESNNRHTIRLSLRTRCPEHAGDLARHLASCGKLLKGNKDLAKLNRTEIKEKVSTYFNAQLEQYLVWLNRRELSDNAIADAREEMLDHQACLDINSLHPQYVPIARFKTKAGVSDEDWNDSQPLITNELRRGRRDLLKAVLEAVECLDVYSLGISEGTRPTALTAPAESRGATLGQAISDYMEEHANLGDEKYQNQVRAFLKVLEDYFGIDYQLDTITRQDASRVKKVVMALPQNRSVKPSLKYLPLLEVIKVEGHKKISTTTINNHIANYTRFFKWARNNGHISQTLFEGMKVAKSKKREQENERKPFTKEQTRLIYNELTQNTSRLVKKDSHKWGALLGLFTGARLNEICQLDIADVKQQDEVWFLNITDEGGERKRVKANASRRKVPIHSELIKLGFLEFVEGRKQHQRLFHDFEYNQNGGYGRSLGRWFNETTFLPKLRLKTRSYVYHSLRHTMVTRLGQAGVEQTIIQELVGHAREGVTQEVYFREGYTLEQLKEAVENFSV